MIIEGESSVPSLIFILTIALTFVDLMPFCWPFVCHFCVSSQSGKCLEMSVVLRPAHVAWFLARTALRKVSFGGNPAAACK